MITRSQLTNSGKQFCEMTGLNQKSATSDPEHYYYDYYVIIIIVITVAAKEVLFPAPRSPRVDPVLLSLLAS